MATSDKLNQPSRLAPHINAHDHLHAQKPLNQDAAFAAQPIWSPASALAVDERVQPAIGGQLNREFYLMIIRVWSRHPAVLADD